MATRTSVGSGLWSVAGTWDTGVPADDDVVVIAAGHTVEFNADQSGFANGIDGLTITGTLKLTRTAGTYYLKIKAAKTITGAGTFDCGTSGDVIGFTAKHTVTGGDGWYINGASGLTMTVYGTEPTNKTILLSGAEAVGQTVLSVDTNVTGDIWAAGDTIRIDDVNNGVDAETRVIAAGGIAAGEITITAALTNAKIVGAQVHLMTRHLSFISVGATGYVCQNFATGKLTISGGQWYSANNYRIFNNCNGIRIHNGTFRDLSYIFNACYYTTITGGVFSSSGYVFSTSFPITITGGNFSGNVVVIGNCRSVTISGGIFKGNYAVLATTICGLVTGGTFFGNERPLSLCGGMIFHDVTFSNCVYGSLANSGVMFTNCTLPGTSGSIYMSDGVFKNCLFTGAIENVGYENMLNVSYAESFDHNQVADAYKAWTYGGVVTSVDTPLPTNFSMAYRIALQDANKEGWYRRKILVPAGKKVTITTWLRKSASMAYLPRVWIFEDYYEPFADATKIIDEFTMTNSVDTWESDTYTYENTEAYDKTIQVRVVGKNATGYIYTNINANFSPCGLGVQIARIP